MEGDEENKKVTETIVKRKVGIAALKQVQKINEVSRKNRALDKKLAKYGISILVLVFVILFVHNTYFDDPLATAFKFTGKVTNLYNEQNSDRSTWFTTIVEVESEKFGKVHAEIDRELYQELKIGDEVKFGHYDRESTIKFSVIERVQRRAP